MPRRYRVKRGHNDSNRDVGERFRIINWIPSSLIADGKNFTADVLASAVVFFGLLGQYMQLPFDRVAAIIVAIFVIKAGWGILVSGMRVLLNASIDNQTLDTIRSTILQDPAVVEVREIKGRNSGRYVFVEADIILRTSGLERAHQISERIERSIAKTVSHVDRIIIHYEPRPSTKTRYALPLANHEGLISDHFGEAPYFAIVDIDVLSRKVERTEVIANPHQQVVKGKGILVANFLVTFKPDIVVTREDLAGKGPGYVFADGGIEIIQTDADELGTFIQTVLINPGPQSVLLVSDSLTSDKYLITRGLHSAAHDHHYAPFRSQLSSANA